MIVRKTKQVIKMLCSGFINYASTPAAKVKFINSCEALGCGKRFYLLIQEGVLGVFFSCHCKAFTHVSWIFF